MSSFLNFNMNKEIKSYLLGFLFSSLLTTLPFLLAIEKFFCSEVNYIIFLLCAISQIIIHFVYFLHLSFDPEERWNLITLLFVIIIIFIVVFGSIWIMFNLNHNTM
ncbi:cytochrome o ubiquinol oxidase subunit IV [Buchnera aphidicola]|uniref:cytochrome o ubiquinol oxidase subunit IV n=1 Tax=Buchnera aphidicola TaxID=9 RepID=UPI000189C5C9|nr:cytochrome o ubiquinol oxidase subunit IV [Buchnera aphidicola]ADP66852.1 cytochrome O ubiquinol oxidase subunit IV [Buchnera aphidicola str. TLW03 (Acyrthosiphon pisum)]ADP67936.1 cytochrome O ubiquinol oxidase subunit IV [Buchnera aphidicola str. JF98 (Acyrthosiphon pisum)]ACL30263.1 cytochrome O ubiquinol oxidase subunit IV [Buchnera aphidicola str. Tuc7 (Acyrthosiphon pisum)]ADP66277.1 cytochrome O ubiquinol oxidase subunit IV [Buchnera aphidicola str. LL01 (Acyrthosiphon pisum)]ADP6743